jgi:hypothetical protein
MGAFLAVFRRLFAKSPELGVLLVVALVGVGGAGVYGLSTLAGPSGTASTSPAAASSDEAAPSDPATALPDEIKRSVADLSTTGALWLDFPFGPGCPSTLADSTDWVGLYFKTPDAPFPPMGISGFVENAHPPVVSFESDTRRMLINTFVADARNGGYLQQINRSIGPLDGNRFCFSLLEAKIGSHYAHYLNGSTETRGLISVASFGFDRADMTSEFDKYRAAGYSTKHRKYHLFARLSEDPVFGIRTFNLERELVIYFDPEDKVWRVDADSVTAWHLAQ